MSSISKTYPRDAIPSWSGYTYQGEIAIVTLMETLNRIKHTGDNVDFYEIGLEDIEDFSIYYMGQLVSTHQVKSTNGKKIGTFDEALYYLAVGLARHIHEEVTAYLHTAHEITVSSWKDEIRECIVHFVPGRISQFEKALINSDILNAEVVALEEKYKNGKIDKRISRERLEILKRIDILRSIDDINTESVRLAIKEYLDGLSRIDLPVDVIVPKIKCYQYENGATFLPIIETYNEIENQIRVYWGEELARLREGNLPEYRRFLQQIINQYVHVRHNNPEIPKTIPLREFSSVLDNPITYSGEQRILAEREYLLMQNRKYCDEECEIGDKCSLCDLYEKMDMFENMNVKEFEKACYMLSPHVKEDIAHSATHLLDENGLCGSTFLSLKSIKSASKAENNKLVYKLNKEKQYMLTAIHLSRHLKQRIIRDIVNNPSIERICNALTKNRDFGPVCMEIDSLIVSDDTAQGVPDIFEEARNIGYKSLPDDGLPSYMKITKKKKVSMTAAESFIDEYRREHS